MTYLFAHSSRVAGLLGQHLVLVGVALAVALVIAVPLGVFATRNPRAGAASRKNRIMARSPASMYRRVWAGTWNE